MLALLALSFAAHAEELAVSSNVRGASILINGSDTGFKTPAVISGLSPGTVVVSVRDQCSLGTAQVEVVARKSNKVNIDASEQLATLSVRVTPAEAVVDVNDGKVKLSPNVPVGLPCGTYDLRAELHGYAPVSYSLELVGGQKIDLPITLVRAGMSTVEISVEPRSATILFDGKDVGKDAVSLPAVYEGLHTLGATLKGYTDAEAPIAVGDGDAVAFTVRLSRGDRGEVEGVGGAGKRALQEGARQQSATEPRTMGDEGPPEDQGPPEDEDEPEAAPADEEEPEEEPEAPEEEMDEGAAMDQDTLDDEPEEDADLAPQSFAERYGGSSETTQATTKSSATVGKKNPKAGLDITGGTMIALGAVVGGGAGGYLYIETSNAYTEWQERQSKADRIDADAAQRRAQDEADDYWNTQVEPRISSFYGTLVAGGLIGATGLVLVLVDGGTPWVMPAPGGGMVGWSASF
ncbi:MAG: PEGA domain-containing protein [Deltaproteobacteria bacterium]|nr:PEGA domain-containing protein [Deltaproteobacteria bacterium]